MIKENLKKRINTSLLLLILLALISKYNLFLIYCLVLLSVFSILEFLQLTKKIFFSLFLKSLINLFFSFYILFFCTIFIFFSNLISLKIILYTSLLGCVDSDIGGFIFGKIFKGPKLTKISPNKTYSGLIGSLIFSSIIIFFMTSYFFGFYNIKVFFGGIIISTFCQIGDLIFSFLKRKADVKDTGSIFPGHGGVLDRLDGILLGVPFGLIAFILII